MWDVGCGMRDTFWEKREVPDKMKRRIIIENKFLLFRVINLVFFILIYWF
jgi:hypothetical protein